MPGHGFPPITALLTRMEHDCLPAHALSTAWRAAMPDVQSVVDTGLRVQVSASVLP